MRHNLIGLTAMLMALAGSSVGAQTPPPGPPTIVAHGEAIVKRAPDQAWLTIATETRDTRAAEARRLNAELMTSAQDALKKAGVAAEAIRTSGYMVIPDVQYANGRSTLRGYIVRNEIEVRVDDLSKLGEIIDAANVPRGTGLTILGPRFGLKERDAAENEAVKLAVQSALARAEAMAAAAKRSVGPIVRIEQTGAVVGPPPPMPMQTMAMRAEQVETPITPGEIEVRAQATVIVEIR